MNASEALNSFTSYIWDKKHKLYGYPADEFPNFCWIESLEARFKWLRNNHASRHTTSIHLLREMLQWGGSQNGVLQKFDDGIGEHCLYDLLEDVVSHLGNPADAIRSALQIPGLGLTYASKLLRFLDPENYGALDGRIRAQLAQCAPSLPEISDGNLKSMVSGYVAYLQYLGGIRTELERLHMKASVPHFKRPACSLDAAGQRWSSEWRLADIEMALFAWTEKAGRHSQGLGLSRGALPPAGADSSSTAD